MLQTRTSRPVGCDAEHLAGVDADHLAANADDAIAVRAAAVDDLMDGDPQGTEGSADPLDQADAASTSRLLLRARRDVVLVARLMTPSISSRLPAKAVDEVVIRSSTTTGR